MFLWYASLDNTVGITTHLGRRTELVKLDLSNAYYIIPVHPDDQPLLAVNWNGDTFMTVPYHLA